MRRAAVLSAFAIVAGLAGPVIAQTDAAAGDVRAPPPEAQIDPLVAMMAGPFMFSRLNDGPDCRITLLTEAVIHAYAISIPETCLADFPALGKVAGWTPLEDGSLRFTDALGNGMMDFTVSEDGLFQMSADPMFTMINIDVSDFTTDGDAGGGVSAFPETLAGNYAFTQKEAPDLAACEVLLSLEPGGEDWYKASLDAACPPELARFEIIGWRVLGDGVELIGKPGTIGALRPTERGPLEGGIEPGLTLRLVRI